MTWRALSGVGVDAWGSTHETRRFGVTMGRVVVGYQSIWAPDVAGELAVALRRDEQILVVRHPAAMFGCAAVLADSGRRILPADNLVYWEGEAEHVSSACGEPADGTAIAGDALLGDDVDRVVAEAFRGYVNHYAVNPRLSQELALEGYVEWARQSVPDNHALLTADGTAVGVATWAVDERREWVEILLAGIVPEAHNRGWYPGLLGHVARRCCALGIRRVIISTQACNVRVQRAWIRAGLQPFATVATAHAVRRD